MIKFGFNLRNLCKKVRFSLFDGIGSGKGFVISSSSAPGLQDIKNTVTIKNGSLGFNYEKNEYTVSRMPVSDAGTVKNGSLNFAYVQNEYVVSKTSMNDLPIMKNGSLSFAYAFDGSSTVYM